MGKKKSKRSRKFSGDPMSVTTDHHLHGDDIMDDEIDAFHKQRDVIRLDGNVDDGDESDGSMEQPVFVLETSDSDSEKDVSDSDGGNDGNSEENAEEDEGGDFPPLAAKIARQAKFLRHRMGAVEADVHEADEQDEEKRTVWGSYKNTYFGADNANFEVQSSDDELRAEEDEALRLQREKAKTLSMEDFGLKDSDEDDDQDRDKTNKSLEIILSAEKFGGKDLQDKLLEASGTFVEIKKDLGALSKEEQMEIVYSAAPELVGLLSELKQTLEQCKMTKSLLFMVKENKNSKEGALRYLEMKQRILFAYCHAIGFYLLLKSEGHSVRDHPVVARLVELRDLVEKVKQIDMNVPAEADVLRYLNNGHEKEQNKVKELASSKLNNEDASAQKDVTGDLVKLSASKSHGLENKKISEKNDQVGLQSKEMLKLRAKLEEKLMLKGIYSSLKRSHGSSHNHSSHVVNRPLGGVGDFDDEVTEPAVGHTKGNGQEIHFGRISQVSRNKVNKSMFASGDDDLPRRDDIGERRRKHELGVLARAGTGSMDYANDTIADDIESLKMEKMDNLQDDDERTSEDEFYKEAKRQRVSKLSAKAEKYSRTLVEPLSLPESESITDGKRLITHQIEKNRGLTRHRKKDIKNPRKKYKMKHKKAMVRRKGQVRDIRKPSGPYGGEATGINIGISRSIRFKN